MTIQMRDTDAGGVIPSPNAVTEKFVFLTHGKFIVFKDIDNLFIVSIQRIGFYIDPIDKVDLSFEKPSIIPVQGIKEEPILEAFMKRYNETNMKFIPCSRFWSDQKQIEQFVNIHLHGLL